MRTSKKVLFVLQLATCFIFSISEITALEYSSMAGLSGYPMGGFDSYSTSPYSYPMGGFGGYSSSPYSMSSPLLGSYGSPYYGVPSTYGSTLGSSFPGSLLSPSMYSSAGNLYGSVYRSTSMPWSLSNEFPSRTSISAMSSLSSPLSPLSSTFGYPTGGRLGYGSYYASSLGGSTIPKIL